MSRVYTVEQQWILQNLALLGKKYGPDEVVLNAKTWRSILILFYRLPASWLQSVSRLLIVLPSKSNLFHKPPDRFYLDKGLRATNGRRPGHYFEGRGYNDLEGCGLARFSFHLKKGWKPAMPCDAGTTLLEVVNAFDQALDQAAREVQ